MTIKKVCAAIGEIIENEKDSAAQCINEIRAYTPAANGDAIARYINMLSELNEKRKCHEYAAKQLSILKLMIEDMEKREEKENSNQ